MSIWQQRHISHCLQWNDGQQKSNDIYCRILKLCNENVFKYQIQEMIPVDYSYDGNQRLEFWNSVKLDDSSGAVPKYMCTHPFWNSVKLDDSSGSNYTASKNKK